MLAFDGKTHPHEVVRAAMARELRSEPLVVHSTSWQHDAESRTLIPTYIAVIAARSPPRGSSAPHAAAPRRRRVGFRPRPC
jgi:hypothetical protein